MTTTGESPTASRIFISYRRENAAYPVGRLAYDLGKHFSGDQVFQDIASIDAGADFGEALQHGLDTCAAVLVVIDPRWLTVSDRQGRRRLDLPDDWVRHEVVESLRRPGVRVFPVLLDTEMPTAEDLPEPLQPLTRRQAFPLTARHWLNDVARLIEALRKAVEPRPLIDTKTPSAALGAGLSQSAPEGHHANQREGTGGSTHVAADPERRHESVKPEVLIGRPRTDARLSRHKVRWVLGTAVVLAALVAAALIFPLTSPQEQHRVNQAALEALAQQRPMAALAVMDEVLTRLKAKELDAARPAIDAARQSRLPSRAAEAVKSFELHSDSYVTAGDPSEERYKRLAEAFTAAYKRNAKGGL